MANDERVSGSQEIAAIRSELQACGVTDGLSYLTNLRLQALHPEQKSPLFIGDNYIPMAITTEEERQASKITRVSFTKEILTNPAYSHASEPLSLIITDMDAGTGTSLSREKEVARHFGRALGSKGTDILLSVEGYPRPLSITEIKLLHYLALTRDGAFTDIILQPLLNFESEAAYNQLLDTEVASLRRDGLLPTYRQLLNGSTLGITLTKPLMQPHFPTVDASTNTFLPNIQAPGGHGYLANRLLDQLSTQQSLTGTSSRIRVISNGEGINNTVPKEALMYVQRQQVGIAMLTTPRTVSDVKVGLFGISPTSDGRLAPAIMEPAQAEQAGQKELFGQIGSPTMNAHIQTQITAMGRVHTPELQDINLNTFAFNENLLSQFLSQLRTKMGEEAFAQIISPDAIQNAKDTHGKSIFQLEGAMGSVVLTLARYVITHPEAQRLWEDISDGPFLSFISMDTDEEHHIYSREDTFSPVKSTWDAIVQNSDRHRVDTQSWHLDSMRPGHQIKTTFEAKGYKQLDVMRSAFANTSLLHLDEIEIKGHHPVLLPDTILRGKVRIVNNFGKTVDLRELKYQPHKAADGRVILENVSISIDEKGNIELISL